MAGALDGLRVLDLSRVLAGPWASQLLGDFGADVVKVERPGSGDETRAWGPPWVSPDDAASSGAGESAYFLSCNRNKRSIAVDLAHGEGAALVRELAGRADVLLENFRAGTLARFGLDDGALRALNPRLVYCTISAWGSGSSRAGEAGYDAMIQAAGGFMSITGAPAAEGGSPVKAGVAIADLVTGFYATSAILAALQARERTGTGQRIEVPLFDAQVAALANQALNFLVGGEVPQRLGTAHPNIVPYQAFATADGHLMLAIGNDAQFRRCIDCLGLAGRLGGAAFASNSARVARRDEVVGAIGAALSERTTAEWQSRLTAASVPCGPVNTLDRVFAEPYVREQALVRRLAHPYDPELPTVANPVRFSGTPVRYSAAPPLLGADTDAVLQEWLGYSAERIDELRASGAIER
ncbi:MAG TPA: CaiB/BaiF CoA-transferase family protein [Woeseiaceae bacterium]|nr:CaiB/BaiF CoA-transferase family protein [Woeseiaceae bacterium]